jgi:hypothetical protein
MRPVPNGQMPASARKSVLLPLPDGPEIRPGCPASMHRLVSARRTRPFGSARFTRRTDRAARRARDGDATRRSAFGPLQRQLEREEAIDARFPARQVAVAVDEPAQRVLHPPEGSGDLDEGAERDRAREEARRGHHDREGWRAAQPTVNPVGGAWCSA